MDADRSAHYFFCCYPFYCLPGSADEEDLVCDFAGCFSLFIKVFVNKHPITILSLATTSKY